MRFIKKKHGAVQFEGGCDKALLTEKSQLLVGLDFHPWRIRFFGGGLCLRYSLWHQEWHLFGRVLSGLDPARTETLGGGGACLRVCFGQAPTPAGKETNPGQILRRGNGRARVDRPSSSTNAVADPPPASDDDEDDPFARRFRPRFAFRALRRGTGRRAETVPGREPPASDSCDWGQ